MNEQSESNAFWNISGPLSSLSGAVLLVGASGRLSHALIIGLCVLFVYSLAPFILKLASPFVPRSYAAGVRLVVAVFFAAVFARIAGIAWPVSVRELSLYIGMVPLCLVSSSLFVRTDLDSVFGALKASTAEALVLGLLAVAFALVREPIGYGVLTLPGAGGGVALFGNDAFAAYSLRSISASAGGFILLGYAIALYRKIKFRLFGSFVCGEEDK